MSKSGGEPAADGDKKYVVRLMMKKIHKILSKTNRMLNYWFIGVI